MDNIRREHITDLLNDESDLVISMYMPMEKVGRDVQGNSIRLKNHLSAAREQLEETGMSTKEIDSLLSEVHKLLNDRVFWQHQSDGLSIFITPKQSRIWRLPVSFNSLTTVGSEAHVKPLLDYLTHDGYFIVLALSQNEVRLYRSTKQVIEQVEPDEMPTSLAEALRYDDPEARLQLHSIPANGGRNTGNDAIYHGNADVESDDKNEILRFCQQIDKALQPFLAQENAPLLIACVDYLYPIYKDANSYEHLLPENISGNPETWSAKEIHEKAWEILAPLFEKRKQTAWEQYQQSRSATDKVVQGVKDVAQAAYQGRIETAFVAKNQHSWGHFDLATGQIELENEPSVNTIDVLDFALIQTLKNGGDVYLVDADDDDIEMEKTAVATLRF